MPFDILSAKSKLHRERSAKVPWITSVKICAIEDSVALVLFLALVLFPCFIHMQVLISLAYLPHTNKDTKVGEILPTTFNEKALKTFCWACALCTLWEIFASNNNIASDIYITFNSSLYYITYVSVFNNGRKLTMCYMCTSIQCLFQVLSQLHQGEL